MLFHPRNFLGGLLLLSSLASALGDNGWEGNILSLTWDNDATAGSDKHYTQGARIAYLSQDDRVPSFLKSLSSHLPALGLSVQAQKWGLALGQEIYTPENLRSPNLIPDDRPYAGWLHGSLMLQRRGPSPATWPAMEDFRLDLGVVGPESLAEETQKAWHGVEPQGWGHQLKTEPGLALRYERRYLLSQKTAARTWGYDFIPHVGGSLGNIATFFNVGSTLRAGYNVPNEFEVPQGETALRFGAYLFGGVDGRLVLRNIFLDGNTFRSSHSVDKEPLVADLKVGLTVVLKRVEFTAAHTFRTREFDKQKSSDSFGTAMVTIKF